MFKTSKHRLLHQVCHISLHIYIYITVLFIYTLFAEMFFMFLHKSKNNCHITFSSLIIQFHCCNPRSLLLICPHKCSKKNGYTIFSSVFEDVHCYPVILLFFVAFSLRQNAATFFSVIDSFGSYFLVIVFIFFAHVQMYKKRGYTICSILFWTC